MCARYVHVAQRVRGCTALINGARCAGSIINITATLHYGKLDNLDLRAALLTHRKRCYTVCCARECCQGEWRSGALIATVDGNPFRPSAALSTHQHDRNPFPSFPLRFTSFLLTFINYDINVRMVVAWPLVQGVMCLHDNVSGWLHLAAPPPPPPLVALFFLVDSVSRPELTL